MRVAWLLAPLPCLVPALFGGCRCGAQHSPPPFASAQTIATATGDAEPPSISGPAVFSAPIGAARVGGKDVVAGFVAADGVVRVMGLEGGATEWSTDALRGVAWAADAELRLQPAADGVAVLWRGLRDGKPVRTLMLLGAHGERRGEPMDVGATFCGTLDGLAWIGPHTTGPKRVRARRWSDPEARDVVTIPPDRDPALVCGDHDVVVLGDGDDDLTATRFVPGDAVARPPAIVLRDADFADEQREHDAYSIGDDLGLVRIGVSGAVAIREVRRGVAPGPWRKLRRSLSPDDDVVTVDGDATATLLVVTHDADSACAGIGSTSESVKALRVDRRTGEESLVDLAPPDCDRARGPYWIATAPSGLVVAWVERQTTAPPKTGAIAGVVFRALRDDGAREGRIEQSADAFVAGGCDDRTCSMAALLREPGSDGMRPAPIRVFGYP